jgi:hypothetical protein
MSVKEFVEATPMEVAKAYRFQKISGFGTTTPLTIDGSLYYIPGMMRMEKRYLYFARHGAGSKKCIPNQQP